MITGAIRNKVDKIWTDIWAGGIANPLTVIEQLTYLMFIRSLDEKELENEEFENMTGEQMPKIFPQSEAGQSMRWSKFKDDDPRRIFEVMSQRVFPAIKSMKYGRLPDFNEKGELIEIEDEPGRADENTTAFARYMNNAMFLIPTPQLLQKIITGLDDLYEHDIAELDMQGDLYEYMLGKLASAGQNGQFRTPKHIREMMVELLQPTPDDTICDPACGTAGFLVSASEYIRRNYEDTMTSEQWEHFAGPAFTGFDTDFTMLRISAMNLMLHSISNPEIDYKDSVSKQNQITEQFTMCLANPPFKGTVDAESINDNLKAVTNTKKTELLFLALFLRMLKKGGQCACIVPDGVLFGSSSAHKSIRKELVEKHQLRAVISMPSGVFKPYAGVSTAVLVFTKTGAGGTDNVWFYDMKADGFSLDDKRSEISTNDIPDIVNRFCHLEQEAARERTEQSFFVPKQEIVDNGYDLSINKYKKMEYVAEEYPSTDEIWRSELVGTCYAQVLELNTELIAVKLRMQSVEKFKRPGSFDFISEGDKGELLQQIASIVRLDDTDEYAKRFDNFMYGLMISAMAQMPSFQYAQRQLRDIGTLLERKISIPQVKAKLTIIKEVNTDAFWEANNILLFEKVRKELRGLMQFLVEIGPVKNPIITRLTDPIIGEQEGVQLEPPYDFEDYRAKVDRYVNENGNTLAIYKLTHNIPLSVGDYRELERVLTSELGSKEDYAREFGNTPFGLLVRKIAKLDHDAAMAAFSQFINDQSLSQKQITFVHKIINHIEQNGYMESVTILTKPPFDKPLSFTKLFDRKMQSEIMATINKVKDNAIVVVA